MTTTIDLDALVLGKGQHRTREEGMCLMEAVAFFAGREHTDRPSCVSPILAPFGISLNDNWEPEARQQLVPIIPLLPGTADDGHDEARGYLALDWLVRTYTPAWLDLAGLTAEGQELRSLRRIVDPAAAREAGPVVRRARETATAAGAAAGAAAGDAAWAAAGDAAWAAAWDAAWAAAWDAAWAAAWDAAWAAAGAAAGDAAWAAAGAAAWAAAGDAAGAAAGDAAWAALRPTVEVLQVSALELFRAMASVGRETHETHAAT